MTDGQEQQAQEQQATDTTSAQAGAETSAQATEAAPSSAEPAATESQDTQSAASTADSSAASQAEGNGTDSAKVAETNQVGAVAEKAPAETVEEEAHEIEAKLKAEIQDLCAQLLLKIKEHGKAHKVLAFIESALVHALKYI